MLKKYLKFNLLFALIFATQLFAIITDASLLKQVTKPLIVICLMAMFAVHSRLKGRFHKRIFVGLLFGLMGDVLLMFVPHDASFFIYGLVAFLLCHILYLSAFYLDFLSAPTLDKKGARVAIFICSLFGMAFYFYIRGNLAALKLPVMAYIFVICFMMMMAVFRNLRVNSLSFRLILIGAMFFIVSDAILAINKFMMPFAAADLLIMATYMIAQYLITIGAVKRKLIAQAQ